MAYWTRWDILLPNHCLSLSSGPDGRSSSKDLPLVMVSVSSEWDAPGFFFGMEWSGQWEGTILHVGPKRDDGPQKYLPPTNTLDVNLGPKVDKLVLGPKENLELPGIH